ncbi:VOC family protein [Peribacillus deserti]|uniref:VOC domain-containing protein n=1 Tax=Peribacillus deserti TaxID=673318 RepID=A0A2N5M4N6_9BACI|nr:VOC family protein [Peribacillus deserti]PLT29320.1 hypothetical protein CUU66_13445 [Peribacillus deserti]
MLHHVEINVSDLSQAAEFWGWLLPELGYELYQTWEKGFSWKHQDTYLVFVQTEEKHLFPPFHRAKTGLNHIAFHGRSTRNVDKLTEKLRGKGIRILYEDKHPFAGGKEHYAVFFEDPDRLKVEVAAPPN